MGDQIHLVLRLKDLALHIGLVEDFHHLLENGYLFFRGFASDDLK